ncbi:MAG: hypothetical protein IJV05_02200 [Muribaculaceae bacterium]|nr:hypothetical protein [Muribaculaceae bacterium]
MKKIVLALAIALLGAMMMNAQPPRHAGADHGQMVQQRVERLDKALSLTEAQKVEITKIYTEEMETMRQNKPTQEASGDETAMKARHEQMEARRQAVNARIEALLTPEQAEKFAQFKDRRGHKGQGMRHGRPHDGKRPRQHDRQGDCKCDCAEK